MNFRSATLDDCALLAELNHQLLRDEGHRNRMTMPELEQRMRGWLASEYAAVIFEEEGEVVAHVLYREQPEEIYLRQLFVARNRRRQGIGRKAVEIMRTKIWPANKRLTSGLVPLDVSSWNHRTYGERLVTYSGTRESMEAATEITLEGYINAASSSAVSLSPDFYRFSAQKAPVDQIGIPSVAYEKRIIEAVFNYVKVLKALGTQGPWYVGLAIINVKKSFLYVDQRYAFGGQTFEGDSIVPPIVEISADTGLENPQAIARTLRPAFDYIWREHGYPRSFNYVPSGDWIGS